MKEPDDSPPADISGLAIVDLEKAGAVEDVADNFLHDMFASFHDHYHNSAETVRLLLHAQEQKEAQILAHSIVGISGSLGAEQVCAAATNLDRALIQGLSESEIELACFEFESSLNRLIAYIYSESFGTRKVLDFSLKIDSSPTHD